MAAMQAPIIDSEQVRNFQPMHDDYSDLSYRRENNLALVATDRFRFQQEDNHLPTTSHLIGQAKPSHATTFGKFDYTDPDLQSQELTAEEAAFQHDDRYNLDLSFFPQSYADPEAALDEWNEIGFNHKI